MSLLHFLVELARALVAVLAAFAATARAAGPDPRDLRPRILRDL